jgi:hypothetical protein
MPRPDSVDFGFNTAPDYYARLGVEPDATLPEIEAAYWGIARELRGQAAMAPYNEAYEALSRSERRRTYDAQRPPTRAVPAAPVEDVSAPAPDPAPAPAIPPAIRPISKLRWVDH